MKIPVKHLSALLFTVIGLFLLPLLFKIPLNFIRQNLILVAICLIIYEIIIFLGGSDNKKIRAVFMLLPIAVIAVLLFFSSFSWRPTAKQIKLYRIVIGISTVSALTSHFIDILINRDISNPDSKKKANNSKIKFK